MLNFRVENKIALVTGCSRGIGMAIATELANSGADIIGVSNDMFKSVADTEKAVNAAGKNSMLMKLILPAGIHCIHF